MVKPRKNIKMAVTRRVNMNLREILVILVDTLKKKSLRRNGKKFLKNLSIAKVLTTQRVMKKIFMSMFGRWSMIHGTNMQSMTKTIMCLIR